MTCPVCDYPNTRPRYRMRDRFFGAAQGEFTIHRCSSCGLLFQKEEEVVERIGDFYPSGYWWKPSGKVSALEKAYRDWVLANDQLAFLRSVAEEPSKVRMLDIGCGNGTLVAAALEAGFDAYGLEQSQEARRLAEAQAPGRIFSQDEKALIEAGQSFDLVTLFHTLEHLPQPFSYLRNLKKLMRPPGKLIVQVPNTGSLQARLMGSRWYGLDCPRHLYNYNPYNLMHLLGRAGYRVHRLRHFSLRDNAAALASSLFPFLDPMSQRVRKLRRGGRADAFSLALREALYFPILVALQPWAWLEAKLGRGATLTVYATVGEKI
ncbi:MAG TPA: class I SAM-dependent methyltransferase [Acidobacteriota bacterium]|nr:class I SAM-dependent methyltransferase [Acidobacteriota bacterium]